MIIIFTQEGTFIMEQKKARFHMPGFTINAQFNLVFLNMYRNMPQFFREEAEIASFYDAFSPAVWNGGRTIGGYSCDEATIRNILAAFNDLACHCGSPSRTLC